MYYSVPGQQKKGGGCRANKKRCGCRAPCSGCWPGLFRYNATVDEDIEYRRICWHSRRGMLELDLVLGPFVERRYRQLSRRDQIRYQRLLECEDQELFCWLLGQLCPQDEDHAHIVNSIREFAGTPS